MIRCVIGPMPPSPIGPMVDRGDRRDLGAGATQEDLVGDVQLAAVDRRARCVSTPSSSRASWMIAARVMPSRMSEWTPGVTRWPSPDHEQVLGGALGHLALVREDDGLLVAVEHRLGLGEGGVHIRADDLRARGDARVAVRRQDTVPHVMPPVRRDVVAERQREDVQPAVDAVELHADGLVGLVDASAGRRRPRGSRCAARARRSGRSSRRPCSPGPSAGSSTSRRCAGSGRGASAGRAGPAPRSSRHGCPRRPPSRTGTSGS